MRRPAWILVLVVTILVSTPCYAKVQEDAVLGSSIGAALLFLITCLFIKAVAFSGKLPNVPTACDVSPTGKDTNGTETDMASSISKSHNQSLVFASKAFNSLIASPAADYEVSDLTNATRELLRLAAEGLISLAPDEEDPQEVRARELRTFASGSSELSYSSVARSHARGLAVGQLPDLAVPRNSGPHSTPMSDNTDHSLPSDGQPEPTHAPMPTLLREIRLSEIEKGDHLGSGGYADVFRGLWNDIDVAVKVLRNLPSKNVLEEFKREMATLSRLRHPNVVLLLGGSATSTETIIVTEFKDGGSLFDNLEWLAQNDQHLAPSRMWLIALDIAVGLRYLHTFKPPIIHRDMKSLNVLLDSDGRASLADFGLSRDSPESLMTGNVGTPAWMAPEILVAGTSGKKLTHYSEKVDIYAYGVILWEMFTCQSPFAGLNNLQIIAGLLKDPTFRPELPAARDTVYHSPLWLEMIKSCWHNDPDKRPHISSIIEFLNTHKDELQREIPHGAMSGSFTLPSTELHSGMGHGEMDETALGTTAALATELMGADGGAGAKAPLHSLA